MVLEVILRKTLKLRSQDMQSVGNRVKPNRAMGCGREAMPEAGLNEVCSEELSHSFERVQRFLYGLRGTAVHKIGMNENACVFKRCRHKRSLIDGNPFFNLFQQPV